MSRFKKIAIGLMVVLFCQQAFGQEQKYNLEGEWILQEWESNLKDLSPSLVQQVKMQELNATYFFRNNGKFYCQPRNNNMLEGSWNTFSDNLALFFEKGERAGKHDTLALQMLKDGRLQMIKEFSGTEDFIQYKLIKTDRIEEDETYWQVADVPPTFKHGGSDSLLILLDNSMEKALGSGYDSLYTPYGINLNINKKGEVKKVDFVMLDSIAINKMVIKEVSKAIRKSEWNPAKVMGNNINVQYKLIMEPKMKSYYTPFLESNKEIEVIQEEKPEMVEKDAESSLKREQIYNFTGKKAMYAYGEDSFTNFVSSNFIMPISAIEKGVSGIVLIEFVVELDGTLTGFKPLGNAIERLGYGLEEEFIRVLKLTSGDWTSAVKDGKPVKSFYRLPFEVDNSGF